MNYITTCFLTTALVFTLNLATAQYFTNHPTFGADQIYVDESGLGWLNLENTYQLGIEDVVSEFGTGGSFEGFRHATIEDINSIVQQFLGAGYGLTPEGVPENGLSLQIRDLIPEGEELIKALGSTLTIENDTATYFQAAGYIYAEDYGPQFYHSVGFTFQSFEETSNLFVGAYNRNSRIEFGWTDYGHFLVTDQFSPVPEPETIGFLGFLGLGGILMVRHRLRSKGYRRNKADS